jgi:hypothetical protein
MGAHNLYQKVDASQTGETRMASLVAQVRALALWRASAATVALGSCAFGGTLILLVVLAVVDVRTYETISGEEL